MKKILLLLILSLSLYADNIITIDERKSDIYFANDMMTSRYEADDILFKIIKPAVKKELFNGDTEQMSVETDFKLAYNNSYTLETDLLEAIYQKQGEHKYFWQALGFIYDAGGKLWTKPLASITKEELEKEVQKYLIEHADEIITQITYNLAEALEERTYVAGIMDTVKLIDAEKVQNAIKYSISTAISLLEQIDINEQTTDMQTSIISGHQVIVMAHSQGNFFMNKVYEGIKFNNPWMTNYIKTIAIASPANSIPDPSTPIITYDNDPITLIPDIAGSFIINPIRYYSIIPQLEYEAMYDGRTLPCISDKYMRGDGNIERCVNEHHLQTVENTNRDFHFFEYYMSPSAALGEETRTNPAYIEIMNFLLKSIRDFKTAPSQWNLTFKSFYDQWTCVDKLAKGSHKYQSTIDTYMQPNYIFTFDSNGKIYQVDGLYVKSSNYNGSKIVNGDNESVHIDTSCSDAKYGVIICGSGDGNGYCYQFKDKQDNTIGSIAGFGGGGGRIDWSIKQIRDIL